jgi:predicted DCC family thiol-disulfide oxidoreductase YuxK
VSTVGAAPPTTAGITVLYDPACPLCARFKEWLARQPLLVRMDLVAAGSPEAAQRFPALDHAQTLRVITVVGDDGSVWTHDRAMVMCLWATRKHRPLAERLATPIGLPMARGAAYSAAGLRHLFYAGAVPAPGGDYGDCRAGTCAPPPQAGHPQPR